MHSLRTTITANQAEGRTTNTCVCCAVCVFILMHVCSTYKYDTRIRIGVECLRACDHAMATMHELQLPLLVFHSTADTLTDPDGSKLLVDTVQVCAEGTGMEGGGQGELGSIGGPGHSQSMLAFILWCSGLCALRAQEGVKDPARHALQSILLFFSWHGCHSDCGQNVTCGRLLR